MAARSRCDLSPPFTSPVTWPVVDTATLTDTPAMPPDCSKETSVFAVRRGRDGGQREHEREGQERLHAR